MLFLHGSLGENKHVVTRIIDHVKETGYLALPSLCC